MNLIFNKHVCILESKKRGKSHQLFQVQVKFEIVESDVAKKVNGTP